MTLFVAIDIAAATYLQAPAELVAAVELLHERIEALEPCCKHNLHIKSTQVFLFIKILFNQ